MLPASFQKTNIDLEMCTFKNYQLCRNASSDRSTLKSQRIRESYKYQKVIFEDKYGM